MEEMKIVPDHRLSNGLAAELERRSGGGHSQVKLKRAAQPSSARATKARNEGMALQIEEDETR
jgi:hypothetical protein